MKVTDRIGNELRAGDTVAWLPSTGKVLIASVQKCIPPGTEKLENGDDAPGKIVYLVEMSLTLAKGGDKERFEVQDVVKSYDPRPKNNKASPLVQ